MSGSNRRREYRVNEIERWKIRVSVVQENRTLEPKLLDVSFNGAGIWFSKANDVGLLLGDHVFLRFVVHKIDDPIHAVAKITFRTDDAGGFRYGLEFTNAQHIHQQVPPKLIGVFNRRRAFRVVPETAEPIVAQVESSTTKNEPCSLEMSVISLSMSGAGLYIKDKKNILSTNHSVTMSFSLPRELGTCRFTADVRYSMEWQAGMRYGVQFVDTGSRRFQQDQQNVMQYVMQQQRKLLKARADMAG